MCLHSINDPEDRNMKTPLLPKNQSIQSSDQTPSSCSTSTSTSTQIQTEKPERIHLTSLVTREAIAVSKLALPMVLTSLVVYSRSLISMMFLGQLGELALAGGSLAVGFANITGYSILSGLAMGMEPICGQAYGAKKYRLLGLTLQRTILLLLFISLPISLLWLNIKRILLFFGQDNEIASKAQSFLVYSIPDLLVQSFLHPLRVYLRTQSITFPITFCALFSIFLHLPINYILVFYFEVGIKGVALSGVLTNFNLVGSLMVYVLIFGVHKKTWGGFSIECFREWKPLLSMALPSCVSVCLEWWWYEIMIVLCGWLSNPTATVASMGILIQTTALIYVFPSSLSFSVSTRVGNEIGANRPDKAKLAAYVGLSYSVVLGLSALLFSLSIRNVWASMFTLDKEIIGLTSLVLPIIGLCELGNAPQTTGCGVLRGTARPKVGANINLGCFYLVGMPVACLLAFRTRYGFEGLWLGLLVAQASCAVTMLVVLFRTDWEFEVERAKKLTGDATAVVVPVVDSIDVEEQRLTPATEIKEDSWFLFNKIRRFVNCCVG